MATVTTPLKGEAPCLALTNNYSLLSFSPCHAPGSVPYWVHSKHFSYKEDPEEKKQLSKIVISLLDLSALLLNHFI